MNETMTNDELTALYGLEPQHIDIADVAKIIRGELKKAFPETKFSVRSSRYSMGCSVSIHYVDGPPTKAVEAITDQFYGTGFDGMTDSTTYHDSDWNGKRVHFAGSRPHVSRKISNHDEIMGRIKAALDIAKIDNPYNYSHEWIVLSSMDLRWETPERAVRRFAEDGLLKTVNL